MKACFGIIDLRIEEWVKGMDIDTIEKFFNMILENPKTGNVIVLTRPFLPFIKAVDELQDKHLVKSKMNYKLTV